MKWLKAWWQMFREHPPTRTDTVWAIVMVAFWIWYGWYSP